MSVELAEQEEIGAVSSESARGPAAPYMSFQGFRGLLDRLKRDGVPQVLDKSFFGQSSGSLTAQIRGTLRFFDLIGEDKRPTPALIELVESDENGRMEILRALTELKYADAIALGTDATQGQLAETFRMTGLSGASLTKAITFYVGLAEYAGVPVSPFFKKGKARTTSTNGATSRRSTRRRKPTAPTAPPTSAASPPVPPLEVKKSAYIDLLMKLVESSGEKTDVQKDLLDRLERALGYSTPPEPKGVPQQATGAAPSLKGDGTAPDGISGS